METTANLKTYPVSLIKALIILMSISSGIIVLCLNSYLDRAVEKIFSEMNVQLQKNSSELIAHRIGMYLHEPQAAGTMMSLMFSARNDVTPQQIQNELQHIVSIDFNKGQPLSSISFTTANGRYTALRREAKTGAFKFVCTNDKSCVQPGQDAISRPWFIRARESKRSFWSENKSRTSRHHGMSLTWRQPVWNNEGRFLGVISADIDPSEMSRWLNALAAGSSRRLMLLNERGQLVASSTYVSRQQLESIRTALPKQRHTQPAVHPVVDHFLMLSRTLEDDNSDLNWRLVMLTPENQWAGSIKHYHLRNLIGLFVVVMLALLTISLLLLKFSHPLRSIIDRVHLLGTPLWAAAARGTQFPEVAGLARALDSKSALIIEMLSARQKQIEYDAETGLLTFTGLSNHVELYNGRNMLALIHLSNYSPLCNLLGNDYGQALIQHLLSSLSQTLPSGTILCRERTDKILAVFPEVETPEQANDLQRRLERLFMPRQATEVGSHELRLASNAGIVEERLTADRLRHVVLNAGIALHHARRQGNGVVTRFVQEMHEIGLRNVQLHEQLHHALERNEFHLVMQPIVSLSSQSQCVEGECLVRWQSPVLGLVSPERFIAMAEQTGLIIPLGNWIINTACRELAEFIARGAPVNFKLHINISPLQLLQDNFAASLLNLLRQHKLQGSNICIEITEGVLLNNAASAIPQLNILRQAGVTVSLDDFGSGYSSLAYLHSLPFDQLKIDRQFVSDLLKDSRSESVIASVLSLARSFKVPLVVEGIENQETGEKLRNMGCGLAQGYYYGRPQRFDVWEVQHGFFNLPPV